MAMRENTWDLLVCGAGVAGVAAALEAGRSGLRVALVEKTILPGGLATSGLVYFYLPLCDGHGTQVQFGLAEELLHLSLKYGPGVVPDWQRGGGAVHGAAFSPAAFVLALDEALEEAQVEPWYDTLVCRPVVEAGRVVGVEVETKRGRERLLAPCVVDATGDADVAHGAGARCVAGTNIMSYWALQASLAAARRAAEEGDGTALLCGYLQGGDADHPPEEAAPDRPWTGTDAQDVTAFVLEGRRMLRRHYAGQHAQGGETARRNLYPLALPTMAQYRTTRRIVGRVTMQGGQEWQEREDSVALVTDWRQPGKVWEVPYGALLPEAVSGLLVVGRCLAAAGEAWQVMRVIPAAAASGQAAGMGAALSHRRGCSPDLLPARAIQEEMERRRWPYHWRELYPPEFTPPGKSGD